MAERTAYTGQVRSRGCLRPLLVAVVLAIVLLVFLRLSGCEAALFFPQIVGQNCGEASASDSAGSQDPEKGELCLWHAYLRCRTATLVFDFQDVDSASWHAITVQPGTNTCATTDNVQEHSGHCCGNPFVSTYQCSRLEQYAGGLVLTSCGAEGSINLPPSVTPAQVGHLCGIIFNEVRALSVGPTGNAPATVASVENCFLKAYTSCTQPATLLYGTLNFSPSMPTPTSISNYSATALHTLVVWQPFGTCLLTDALRGPGPSELIYYDCTRMDPIPGGGLVVQGCGSEGDITLPASTQAN